MEARQTERSSWRRPARRPRHLLSLTQSDGERLPDSSANGLPVRAPHTHPARAGRGNKPSVELPHFSLAIPVQKRGGAAVLPAAGLGEAPSISLQLRMLGSVPLSQTTTEVSRPHKQNASLYGWIDTAHFGPNKKCEDTSKTSHLFVIPEVGRHTRKCQSSPGGQRGMQSRPTSGTGCKESALGSFP